MKTTSNGAGALLKSETIALTFREEILESLKTCSRAPCLVGILATSLAPSKMYADFTRKTCDELGIHFVLKIVGAAVDVNSGVGEGVEEAIIEANDDEDVDGIMVYYPIFGLQQDHYLQQIVSPFKDVEGLHAKFHYNMYHNVRFIDPRTLSVPHGLFDHPDVNAHQPPAGTVKSILPCTPLAVVKTLEYIGVYNKHLKYGDRAYGRIVTVINRSEVVGRPLAALLANDGARVFSVDVDSIQEYTKRPATSKENLNRRYHTRHVVQSSDHTLQNCLSLSDVVVSAVPDPVYKVPSSWLKDGCICINVSSEKNFESDVREKASLYLPSVGKVTILMLLRNLIRMRQYDFKSTI